jgi:hypothetical protein
MSPAIQHRNRTVRVDQFRVVENALTQTYLTTNISASSGTLTVKDIAKFAIGKYVWINPFSANSEIIAVHASTAPSGSTITLASSTTYAHTAGETIYYIEFNQLEISHADTIAGSKTVLETSAMTARQKTQVYLDITKSVGFYFARYKDSIAGTFGSYSDPVPYNGWETDTVGYMIESSLRDLSLELSNKITLRDCYSWLNLGIKQIKGKIRRWAEHYVYDYVAGQAVRGTNTVTLPTNIYDSESNRSIEAVRIGTDRNLHILSPGQFDAQMNNVCHTQVTTQATSGGTTLEIDNSYDFADSGTVTVYVSGTKYDITYTGVTRSATAGVLTGVPASGTGSISVTIPVDTNVWQNEIEGQPTYFTVRNGQGEFYPLVSSEYDNANVTMDYNTVASEVNSESDVIDYQRYDILESYLKWKLWCKANKNGELDRNSGFYLDYKESLNDAIRTMPVNKTKTAPNINRMSRNRSLSRRRPDIIPSYES